MLQPTDKLTLTARILTAVWLGGPAGGGRRLAGDLHHRRRPGATVVAVDVLVGGVVVGGFRLSARNRNEGPLMTPPVRLHHVRKTYARGVVALDGVTVDFPAGSMTAVMGPSGSGKSTLLHCAAGLDEPDSGEVTLVGVPLAGKTETELTELRREHVAFVFQQFNLMPALTVRQNVTLPALLADVAPDEDWVTEVLRPGRARRPGRPPAERAVRRAAAAGGDRPGAGQPRRGRVRRRADRRARQPDRARGARAAPGGRAAAARRSSSSPTTRWPPHTPTRCCSWSTAGRGHATRRPDGRSGRHPADRH